MLENILRVIKLYLTNLTNHFKNCLYVEIIIFLAMMGIYMFKSDIIEEINKKNTKCRDNVTMSNFVCKSAQYCHWQL